MDRKKRQKIQKGVRITIQLVFLLLAPAVFTSAYAGEKYIFTQFASSQMLEWNAFLKALLGICLFTILFGRFFCGYACAFGTLGDLLYMFSAFVQKKTKKKLPKIPEKVSSYARKIKYLVLAGVAVTCLLGIYDKFRGSSPWDVFSRLTSLQLPGRDYLVGIIILVVIMAGMMWEERFFCKYLCPMGAVFSLLPILPAALYRRERESCINGCSACKRQCPVSLDIDGDGKDSGECIQCNQCLITCPKENIHTGIKVKGNEIWLVIGKAVVFLVVCFLLQLTR